jgi:hypothetical protein
VWQIVGLIPGQVKQKTSSQQEEFEIKLSFILKARMCK